MSRAGTPRRRANPVQSATNGSAVRCRVELDDPVDWFGTGGAGAWLFSTGCDTMMGIVARSSVQQEGAGKSSAALRYCR